MNLMKIISLLMYPIVQENLTPEGSTSLEEVLQNAFAGNLILLTLFTGHLIFSNKPGYDLWLTFATRTSRTSSLNGLNIKSVSLHLIWQLMCTRHLYLVIERMIQAHSLLSSSNFLSIKSLSVIWLLFNTEVPLRTSDKGNTFSSLYPLACQCTVSSLSHCNQWLWFRYQETDSYFISL